MGEILVVLATDNPKAAQAARGQVKAANVHITQRYGSDVLIVETTPEVARSLMAHPGVAGVYEGTVLDNFSSRLDEVGRLGIAAWNERHTTSFEAAKQQRKGEGLPWGHSDFEPEG